MATRFAVAVSLAGVASPAPAYTRAYDETGIEQVSSVVDQVTDCDVPGPT